MRESAEKKRKVQKSNYEDMVRSRYWQPVHIAEWFSRLEEACTRARTSEFSIVYRFYSTVWGSVRYVGRSDNPFSRESGHYFNVGVYGIHERLGGRVTWVDFMYITGLERFRESFEEECKQFHYHEPELNTNHPAKLDPFWECPICKQ